MLIKNKDAGSFQSKLLCGALTGITANTITYPLDLVKTILSVQLNPRHYKKGILGHLKIIYSKEGILGFYKGWGTTMVGIAPYIAIKMATFDVLKTQFCPDKDTPHFDMINLACGAAAGMISMGATYPLDLVKRRIQLAGLNKHARPYDGLLHCIVSMMLYEGPRSFWKGLNPCILKMIPATAILFAVNERLKKWMSVE
uniref:Mitochondrial carrier protein n=1 Tax=Euplotes crassus TaxID=5936 RepID=A0A7S3KJ38_EUPCR|mmetsp:Transcript_25414/g.25160  ORF Transcript_25414/g.25160 Transcript_25414/m.25160 type:complete len:199 (+) Transcript_25414:359-955(+)